MMSSENFPTLIGLVSHYSPSGAEGTAVAWLVQHMQTLGYSSAYTDEAGNAIGVMGDGPRQIVLLGHIDTVPGEIPVRVEAADLLYGRGSVDAKGALAAFVEAASLVGPRPGWQFAVIGAVDEERDSSGARFVASRYKPDYAIIGEPNRWDRLALGYKGSAWAEVTIKRDQAHSASGETTACEAAVEAWLKIQTWAEQFNAGKERTFDQILPTLRGLASGAGDFDQWARLSVGARLPLELTPEAWYARLRELAQGAQVQLLGFPIPAWACAKNTPLVRAFLTGIRHLGGSPSFVYKTGTADLNIVAPLWACPALVYGPGDSALDHTPQEHLSLAEYRTAVQVIAKALEALSER